MEEKITPFHKPATNDVEKHTVSMVAEEVAPFGKIPLKAQTVARVNLQLLQNMQQFKLGKR